MSTIPKLVQHINEAIKATEDPSDMPALSQHHEDIRFGHYITYAQLTKLNNGALVLTGALPVLKAVRDRVQHRVGICLTIDTSYKIDGVEQLKSPYISVHPQAAAIVADLLADDLFEESPDNRAHRLYQQHGADTLTKAKKLLREAYELVGTPDALDLLASAQCESVEKFNDEDVNRVARERYELLTRLATRLR